MKLHDAISRKKFNLIYENHALFILIPYVPMPPYQLISILQCQQVE